MNGEHKSCMERSSTVWYEREQCLVAQVRPLATWVSRAALLAQLVRLHPALFPQPESRAWTRWVHPKNYKMLDQSVPFLSPLMLCFRQRTPWVLYSRNDPAKARTLPLVTWLTLWEILGDSTQPERYQTPAYWHDLLPAWTLDEWTAVLGQLQQVYRRTTQPSALLAERRRLEHTAAGHFPWWREDEVIRLLHEELDLKWRHRSPLHLPVNAVTYPPLAGWSLTEAPSVINYILPVWPATVPRWQEVQLLLGSRLLYEHYQGQRAMASLQQAVWQGGGHLEQARRRLDGAGSSSVQSCCQVFPSVLSRLREVLSSRYGPRLSPELLFKVWQQARGDWEVVGYV